MADATVVLSCGDNYVYVYPCDGLNALVVDPSDAGLVLDVLERERLTLMTVLVTHHHGDHTAGVRRLKARTGCQVVGADARRISGIDRIVADGDILTFGDRELVVLETPGHTRTSVCFYLRPGTSGEPGIVWTGDTLFVGGCGRPMEDEASVLWQSLTRLAALPDETLVYCGHDYTAESYEFALTIESGNQDIQRCLESVLEATRHGEPSVPSTIGREKQANIFLRSDEPPVRTALGMADATAAQVFTELRHRKNLFG